MAYRLEPDAGVGEELRRVAREQIERGIEELDGEMPVGEKAHQVRKRCKKVRALLRLYRPVLGKAYKKENRVFRDLGRKLAPIRDADSLLETYDELLDAYADEVDRSGLGPLRRRLTEHRQRVYEEVDTQQLVASARETLEAALVRLERWVPKGDGYAAIRGGLKKSYKRGRARLEDLRSASEPDPELAHEWRKRVKYHWYHLRLVAGLWSELIRTRASETHRLSNYLGASHDLAELEEALRGEIGEQANEERTAVVTGLAEQERRGLLEKAVPLGRRVIAQRPGALVNQFRGLWHAGKNERELW